MFIATATGHLLQLTGSYHIVFFIAGLIYLMALGIIHVLAPRLEPASRDRMKPFIDDDFLLETDTRARALPSLRRAICRSSTITATCRSRRSPAIINSAR